MHIVCNSFLLCTVYTGITEAFSRFYQSRPMYRGQNGVIGRWVKGHQTSISVILYKSTARGVDLQVMANEGLQETTRY